MLVSAFDTSALGVHVKLGAIHIDALRGVVEIGGLRVENPRGYRSDYALIAHRVLVDIGMRKLIFSLGKEIDLEVVALDGVDIIFEKARTTSNLNDILTTLQENTTGLQNADDKPQGESSKKQDADKDKADVHVTLHKVTVKNIGAKLTSVITKGVGPRLELGDLFYEDFDREVGAARAAGDAVRVLLMTIIKSIIASVFGKSAARDLEHVDDGAPLCGIFRSLACCQRGRLGEDEVCGAAAASS